MNAANEPHDAPDESMNDHALLQKLRDGHESAAVVLYKRYAQQLRQLTTRQTSATLASRFDADDIVQSVFRTFFRRVNTSQYDVPGGEDLWRLFMVIALNKIRNAAAHHKAAKRDVRATKPIDTSPLGVHYGGVQSDDTDMTVLRLLIDETISGLPEFSREIVRLRIDGCQVAEIALQTKRSKRSVERVLQQFRDQLQGLLHDPQ